jgi:DNA replication protein DnaC
MGLQIAHFPCVRTLDDFDFGFQSAVEEWLIRDSSSGQFISNSENSIKFGSRGVGNCRLAVGLGRKIVEQGHTVRFITAMGLPASLSKGESEGSLELK